MHNDSRNLDAEILRLFGRLNTEQKQKVLNAVKMLSEGATMDEVQQYLMEQVEQMNRRQQENK